MKIAICGATQISLPVARAFCEIGAQVCIFTSVEEADLVEDQLRDLGSQFSHLQLAFNQINRIQKSFLYSHENIDGRSRILDTFRVVYAVTPSGEMKTVGLPDEVIDSLNRTYEAFAEFDFIWDGHERFITQSCTFDMMGVDGKPSINETHIREQEQLAYANSDYSITGSDIAIVGRSPFVNKVMIEKREILHEKKVTVITPDPHLFVNVDNRLKTETESILQENVERFEEQVQLFQKKLADWKALEDFEKVKISRPEEPIPAIMIEPSMNIESVDQLIDREGIFLSIERPAFRGDFEQKTLGFDQVIIANENDGEIFSLKDEPGYYTDHTAEKLVEDAMKYFSRNET